VIQGAGKSSGQKNNRVADRRAEMGGLRPQGGEEGNQRLGRRFPEGQRLWRCRVWKANFFFLKTRKISGKSPVNGKKIRPGDVVLGLASSGAHSNGYSLVRKIIDVAKPDLHADFHGRPLADVLLAPTRIYVKPLLALMEKIDVHGMVHITGGGLVENIPRVLQPNLTAVLHKDAWTLPPLFQWLQQHGGVADDEMHRVFNCGIGMTVIVSAANADQAEAELKRLGETVYRIGEIRERAEGEAQTVVI
jgi:phosphoribosylformylglycinamidine cyclo-ligase